MTNSYVTLKLDELKKLFPNGKVWNYSPDYGNVCLSVTKQYCNHSVNNNASFKKIGEENQCLSFTLFMSQLVFGSYPTKQCAGTEDSGWVTYTNCSDITLEPGDIIRMQEHSAIVHFVNGQTVKVVELLEIPGNSLDTYKITWGYFNSNISNTKTVILNDAEYIQKAPKTPTLTTLITFNATGGECDIQRRNYIVGSSYAYLPIPTRNGYTFVGWWPQKNRKKVEHTVFSMVNSDVTTLYAHWVHT